MAEDARLQIVLRLRDEASKKMKNIDNTFKKRGAAIGKSVAGGSVVAGGAILGIGTGLVKTADQMKMAENQLRLGTGAMGDELDALMASTRSVAGQVPQDFVAVATAVADTNTEFGLVGKPLEEMTRMFLDVARVAKTEAGPMIKGVSDIMEIFGVDQAEANRILGDFITVAQNTGQPLEKVISDMVTYGPVLKNAGMETDEAAGFLGAFAKVGVDASRVMPGIKKRVDDLSKEGLPDLHEALMNDIIALSNIEDAAYQSDRALKIFGGEGAARITAAINADLIPALEDLDEKMGLTDDEVQNLTAGTLTTSEEFAIMKNKVMALIEPFAEYLALIGAILIPIGGVTLAVGLLAGAFLLLGASLWPVLAVIAAVVAAVVIGVVIYKQWDNIMAALGATWDFVWGGIKKVFDLVWGALDTKIGKLIALFLPFGPLIVGIKLLAENWDTVWNGIKAVVLTVAKPIVSVINAVIGAINGLFGALKKVSVGWPKKEIKFMPDIPAFGPWSPFSMLPTIPKIPSFAKGGIVTKPTFAQIGEAGPEAIVPLKAGAGMGTTININFPQGSTVFLDNEESARSLADQITQQIRGVLRAQGAF